MHTISASRSWSGARFHRVLRLLRTFGHGLSHKCNGGPESLGTFGSRSRGEASAHKLPVVGDAQHRLATSANLHRVRVSPRQGGRTNTGISLPAASATASTLSSYKSLNRSLFTTVGPVHTTVHAHEHRHSRGPNGTAIPMSGRGISPNAQILCASTSTEVNIYPAPQHVGFRVGGIGPLLRGFRANSGMNMQNPESELPRIPPFSLQCHLGQVSH